MSGIKRYLRKRLQKTRILVKRAASAYRFAKLGFQQYRSTIYYERQRIFKQEPCSQCAAKWSTDHNGIQLCEPCIVQYHAWDRWYHSASSPLEEACRRLQHQQKWFGLRLQGIWWLARSSWNDAGHWERIFWLLGDIPTNQPAIQHFAAKGLDLLAAYQIHLRYNPHRIERREDREEYRKKVSYAVQQTINSMKNDRDMHGLAHSEEWQWWGILLDEEADTDAHIWEYAMALEWFHNEDYLEVKYRDFIRLFWSLYLDVFE